VSDQELVSFLRSYPPEVTPDPDFQTDGQFDYKSTWR
jgi:hypothetical protein